MLIVTTVFIYLRRKRVTRVVINNDGVIFHGLMRKDVVAWREIQSIANSDSSLQDSIEIRTRKGAFIVPAIMREEAAVYPKLVNDTEGQFWVSSDGTRRAVTSKNSPLYAEIQRRMAPNQAL